MLKEQGIWALLFGQLSKIDKSVLELQEEKTHSLIIFSLFDETLYEVFEELTIIRLWLNLEKLFMTILICNKFLLKQHLFGLRMREGMPLKEHLDKLNFFLKELGNLDVKMENEDLEMIMLAFLPPFYENFVSFISVGKDSTIVEEVKYNVYSRELQLKTSGNGDEASTSRLSVTGFAKEQKKNKGKDGK